MKQFWGCRQQDKKARPSLEKAEAPRRPSDNEQAKEKHITTRRRPTEDLAQAQAADHATLEEENMKDDALCSKDLKGDAMKAKPKPRKRAQEKMHQDSDEAVARQATEEERKMSTSYEESSSNPRKSPGLEDKRCGAKAEDKRSGVKDEPSKQGAAGADGDRER